ncbi:MAG: DUF1934 domain-containing protein [Clostridiales bacterium]|jgi:uncharacterized beta-barrel protein YwiB (DUF1934 family)|nr:DUF1934 domain-containing protein [Clostridiales bacterium]
MEKNVIVSVVGLQINEGERPDLMELVTEGTYRKKGDAHYISYQESEMTGMEGTTTTIKAAGDELTLIRFGAVNSQFVFRQGKKHLSHYDTGFGSFTVDIMARNVEIDIGEHSGNIRLGYEMAINDGEMVFSDVLMQIREAAPGQAEFSADRNGSQMDLN